MTDVVRVIVHEPVNVVTTRDIPGPRGDPGPPGPPVELSPDPANLASFDANNRLIVLQPEGVLLSAINW